MPAADRSIPPPLPEPLVAPTFDAHCHLDAMAQRAGLEPTDDFVRSALAQARSVNVLKVITVGDTVTSSRWCAEVAARHADVYAAVAVHPTEIDGLADADYDELERLAAQPKVIAIGETGLDYYWDRTDPKAQQEHFRRHIELAKRTNLPLMIHDRDAHADVLDILASEGAPERVVFHAFSGDEAMARTCVERGFTLSFPGVVTFTNAPSLRSALAVTPLANILVETDAPFLTPVPYRGRPNAPYLVPHTLLAVSAVLDVPVVELATQIAANGERLFGLKLT